MEGDKPAIVDFYADWWSLQNGSSYFGRIGKRIRWTDWIYKVDTGERTGTGRRVWYTEYSVHSVHPHGRKAGDGTGAMPKSVI